MNPQELDLQRHPMFFKVYLEVEKRVPSQAIFEKFQTDCPDHQDLRRVIAGVEALNRKRNLGPAIGWSIPAVVLGVIALAFLLKGNVFTLAWVFCLVCSGAAFRHWQKLFKSS